MTPLNTALSDLVAMLTSANEGMVDLSEDIYSGLSEEQRPLVMGAAVGMILALLRERSVRGHPSTTVASFLREVGTDAAGDA